MNTLAAGTRCTVSWLKLCPKAKEGGGNLSLLITLRESPVVGPYANLLSYPLPITEILIGCSLLLPVGRKYGLPISALLMLIFTAYNIYLESCRKGVFAV